ncbi:MAG: hypothetical protein II718_01960, partial [Clostridiales bacterium]|nr:hypothetical protein [Clostridiales bacterium]
MRRDNNRENELSIFYIVASVVLWIITLAWMYLIFFLSSETGEDSSKDVTKSENGETEKETQKVKESSAEETEENKEIETDETRE